MKSSIIKETVLQKIYQAHFASSAPFNVPGVRDENEWDEALFNRIVRQMVDDDLISGRVSGGYYQITQQGILYAESNDLVPRETRRNNHYARMTILDALAVSYQRQGNVYVGVDFLAQETSLDKRHIALSLQVLGYQGYAHVKMGGGWARITDSGLEHIARFRLQSEPHLCSS